NCFCTNLWLKTRSLKPGTAERPPLRLGPQGFQPTDRIAPQAVKFAHRQHHAALQTILQFSKLEGGPAEPAELFAQPFRRQRLLLGHCQRQRRGDLNDMPNLVTHDEREWLTISTMNFDVDRPLELRVIAFKRRAESAVEVRVAGLPNLIADMNAGKIDVATTEPQLGLTKQGRRLACLCGNRLAIGPPWMFFFLSCF